MKTVAQNRARKQQCRKPAKHPHHFLIEVGEIFLIAPRHYSLRTIRGYHHSSFLLCLPEPWTPRPCIFPMEGATPPKSRLQFKLFAGNDLLEMADWRWRPSLPNRGVAFTRARFTLPTPTTIAFRKINLRRANPNDGRHRAAEFRAWRPTGWPMVRPSLWTRRRPRPAIFHSDLGNARIEKISPNEYHTVAGAFYCGRTNGDNNPALSVQLITAQYRA